jgi:hypothetical protein
MIGADVGASAGRPEYIIPQLDLDGYFDRFLLERRRILDALDLDFEPTGSMTENVEPPASPEHDLADVDEWIEALHHHPDLRRIAPWRKGIETLQKKFAVFGRIQTSYDASMRKTSDTEVAPASLCRLARLFLDDFRIDGDWNALNTAIKILDKVASMDAGTFAATTRLVFADALKAEEAILREILDA